MATLGRRLRRGVGLTENPGCYLLEPAAESESLVVIDEAPSFVKNLMTAGGEAGRLIAMHDWSRGPLGPVDAWPQSLRTTVGILIRSPVPIVLLWGEDGVMLYNDAYSALAGGRHPQILGSKVRDAWPEVADFNDHVMRVGLAGGALAYRDQELTLHRNGSPEQVWMDLDYSPVPDETGRPAGVMAIVVETTQRVLAERRARMERERLLQAFEQAPGFISVMRGPSHVVEFVNDTHRRMFGSDHWIGKPIREAFPEIADQGFFELLDGVYATGERHLAEAAPVRYRLPGTDKEEQRFLSFVYAPIRDPSGSIGGILVEGSDVTERETAATQLRQAQKMEAVGQLTGGLAHDFNNLLSIIIGNLDLIEDELEEDAPAREFSEAAITAALKGSDLTKQLLAFSRRQPLAPKIVDLNELVSNMTSMLGRTIGESVALRFKRGEGVPPTLADPSQIESALLNLAINARDAMPSGGVLTIETGVFEVDEDYAAHQFDAIPGLYSVVAVSDSGEGMPPEVLAKAFEPFFTTKAVGKGSGLGLSMIYGFAKQSRGHVRIYSEVGRGTTVRLFLPAAESGAGLASGVEALGTAPLAAGQTVLVVEDNAAVRRIAVRQLQDLGYTVLEAENGEAALGVLRQNRDIDLLFTDVVMPGMSGIELVEIARRDNPGLKVLYTTGFTEAAADEIGGFTGSDALITKPYRKADLALRARQVFEAPVTSNR